MTDTLTMQQVADLAAVKRPVVSTWRARSLGTDHPFPAPVEVGARTFQREDVVAWLERTGYGNNREAALDSALHSSRFDIVIDQAEDASRLLLLQAMLGEPLVDVDHAVARETLTQAAQRPGVGSLLPVDQTLDALANTSLVASVDALVEAGYSSERVLWRMLAALRSNSGQHPAAAPTEMAAAGSASTETIFTDSALTVEGVALAAALLRPLALTRHVEVHGDGALALAAQVAGDDVARGTTTIIQRGLVSETLSSDATVGGVRGVVLRALAAHGADLDVDPFGARALHLVMEATVTATAAPAVFERVQALSRDLMPGDVAIILAPADLLVGDVTKWPSVDLARRACFDIEHAMSAVARHEQQKKPGQQAPDYCLPLRYVATLPKGMLRAAGRRRLGLWVLAPRPEGAGPAFTTYGDHANHTFSTGECDALAADVAAAVALRQAKHAYLRARHRTTLRVLNEPSLVISPTRSEARNGGEVLAEAWEHERRAGVTLANGLVLLSAGERAPYPPVDWSELVTTWASVKRGHRVPDEITAATRGALADVIGPDEVSGARSVGSRRVERLEVERVVPQVKYTRPGDVVFTTVGGPAAIVDERGGSVVQAPARILRARRTVPEGWRFVPAQAAHDINAQRGADVAGWQVRVVPVDQADAANELAGSLSVRRTALRAQLEALDAYETTVMSGIAQGLLRLGTVHDMQTDVASAGGVR